MLSLLALFTKLAQTYLQSLQKDLAQNGFEGILLITSISWVGVLMIFGLFVSGQFQMPTDPRFYLFWLALVFLTTIQFILFLGGLVKTGFFAANTFSNLGFLVTIIYSVLFLRESISSAQGAAAVMSIAGAALFFQGNRTIAKTDKNKGLYLIFFSLFISPLGAIFYKSATAYTVSYNQFLSGRLVMDAVYYSLLLFILYLRFYRKNPVLSISLFISSKTGLIFMFGTALLNLLDSWLIYKLSLINFTILGAISIPTSYLIGRIKYKEHIGFRFILGSLFITAALIFAVI